MDNLREQIAHIIDTFGTTAMCQDLEDDGLRFNPAGSKWVYALANVSAYAHSKKRSLKLVAKHLKQSRARINTSVNSSDSVVIVECEEHGKVLMYYVVGNDELVVETWEKTVCADPFCKCNQHDKLGTPTNALN